MNCNHKPSKPAVLAFSRKAWVGTNVGVQRCRKCGESIRPRRRSWMKAAAILVFFLLSIVFSYSELHIISYYPPAPYRILIFAANLLALCFYLFGGELFSWEPAEAPDIECEECETPVADSVPGPQNDPR